MQESRGIEEAIEVGIKEMVVDRYRYRGGVEPPFQNSFSRNEKHRHECNPTCNTTNDLINILSSQKHTHTLNKSNQFYISKTKLKQFSEHTLTHVKPCDGQFTLYLHMYQE